jgi:glycosyltransferase involved in cell wall biosynthesis
MKKLILFIHGLGGNPEKSWGSFSNLLKMDKDLESKYDIKYYTYPTAIFRFPWSTRYPKIHDLADALRTQINNRYSFYQEIILICHSLGGLIAKKYVAEQIKNNNECKIKLLILFATPNNGAHLANLAAELSFFHTQLIQLCKNSDFLEDLNGDWSSLHLESKIPARYIYGTLDTIVDKSSAISFSGNKDIETVHANHSNIIKPLNSESDSFLIVRNLLIPPKNTFGPEINPSIHRHTFSMLYPKEDSFLSENIISCNGTHDYPLDSELWIVLEDKIGNYYLQSPKIRFDSETAWHQNNTRIGKDIIKIFVVYIKGNEEFVIKEKNENWEAFKNLPTNSEIVAICNINTLPKINRDLPKDKIKVLMITNQFLPNIGGIINHVFYLSFALSKLYNDKCSITVFTTFDSEVANNTKIKEENENIEEIRWRKRNNFNILHSKGKKGHFLSEGAAPFEKPILQAINQFSSSRKKPDIIHVHDFESAYIGMMLKSVFKVPLILTVHKTPKEWDIGQPLRDIKDCFLQAISDYKIPDIMVAPSDAYQERLIKQGFDKSLIKKINHGIPVKWLTGIRKKTDLQERFDLKDNNQIILCPSRLDPHKGPDILIEAAYFLKKEIIEHNLVFVFPGAGSSEYREQMEKRAIEYSSKEYFRFGPVDGKDFSLEEMSKLYRQCLLSVLPSRRDGFPQALLESMAFKKPVIASNTGGIPEIIDTPESNGLLFHRDDPEDLAKQIKRVLQDNTLFHKLSEKGFETVTSKYDSEIMAKKYFDLYKKTIDLFNKP